MKCFSPYTKIGTHGNKAILMIYSQYFPRCLMNSWASKLIFCLSSIKKLWNINGQCTSYYVHSPCGKIFLVVPYHDLDFHPQTASRSLLPWEPQLSELIRCEVHFTWRDEMKCSFDDRVVIKGFVFVTVVTFYHVFDILQKSVTCLFLTILVYFILHEMCIYSVSVSVLVCRWTQIWFLARLHFSAEELLLYPRRPRQRQRPHAKC